MTDPARDLGSSPRDGDQPPGMPRWVKVSLGIAALLLAVFLILKLAGVGGRHGPGMHQAAGASQVTGGADDILALSAR